MAEIEAVRGDDMEHVLDAFRMSALTASHEGSVMNRRALFGLQHWTELPEQDRNTVVRDLLVTAKLPEFRTAGYRAVIARKSQPDRDGIGVAFRASGLADESLLQALGL
jgi:hypothetical protein